MNNFLVTTELREAIQGFIGWYDAMNSGLDPTITELDFHIKALLVAPNASGPVKQDLDKVLKGGREQEQGILVEAIERLRVLTGPSGIDLTDSF